MGLYFFALAAIYGLLGSFSPALHRFWAVLLTALFLIQVLMEIYKKKRLNKRFILQINIFCITLLYFMVKNMSAWFYLLLANIAHYFSGFAGALFFREVDMGITYSGIDTVILFLIAFTATYIFSGKKPSKSVALPYGLVFIIWLYYVVQWTGLAENSLDFKLNLFEPVTGPLDFKVLLFLLLLALYQWFCGKDTRHMAEEKAAKGYMKPGIVLGAVCLGAGLLYLKPVAKPEMAGGHIVFWDSLTDYTVPDYSRYGLDNVGMFGVLPHHLERKGYTYTIAEEITEETLSKASVFAVFNPYFTPDQVALELLWDFVDRGGSILLVGDHTGTEQMRDPINAILAPTGMSLNFDSAVPFKSLWTDDFILRKSPIFYGVLDRQVQLVVGASITVPFGGRPLVIGRGGFSDDGDLENAADGYLGDMHFSRGERVGDLVLAAEVSYGQGRFMLFADTSLFQNTIIAYSYPFVDNIFAYLSNINTAIAEQKDIQYPSIGIIDTAHLENIGRDKTGHAVDAILSASLRAGIMPFLNMTQATDDILKVCGDAAFMLIIEPAAFFSKAEKQALEEYMESGGTVILSGYYDSPKATADLVEYFGFTFDDLPIGRISPVKNPDMAFWNACPLLYEGQSVGYGREDVECVMDIWDYGVIAAKSFGKGKLYVFGDPDYFKNKNVEDVDTYRQGNVDFIDGLLKEAAGRGGK